MAFPEGIVFDFDGVLADTVQAHTTARLEAFDRLNLTVAPELHQEAHRHGSHPPEIIGWVLKSGGYVDPQADVLEDPTVTEVVALKDSIYNEHAAAGLLPVENAIMVVGWAAITFGKSNIAIATTASRVHEVAPFLERHKLTRLFGAIVAKEDTPKGKMKPDGFAFTEAACMIRKWPHTLIAIEDSPRGVCSAVAANIPVIGVMTTHDHKDLTLADHIVGSMGEVPDYISDLR